MEYIRTHVMLPPGAKTSFKAYLEDQAVDLYFFGGFKYDVVITVPSTLGLWLLTDIDSSGMTVLMKMTS